MKQHGYIDIDFGSVFIGFFVVGAFVVIVSYKVLSWVWPYIKQFIIWSLT